MEGTFRFLILYLYFSLFGLRCCISPLFSLFASRLSKWPRRHGTLSARPILSYSHNFTYNSHRVCINFLLLYFILSTRLSISYSHNFTYNSHRVCINVLLLYFILSTRPSLSYSATLHYFPPSVDKLFALLAPTGALIVMMCFYRYSHLDSIAVSVFLDYLSLSNQKQIQTTI